MNTAIEFAHDSRILMWIDLRVFAHNTAAHALYRSLGFVEIGTVPDRFRIEGESIDDILMTLRLSTPPRGI
jgi:RimJ/RimL family protein N-acetyltransferase